MKPAKHPSNPTPSCLFTDADLVSRFIDPMSTKRDKNLEVSSEHKSNICICCSDTPYSFSILHNSRVDLSSCKIYTNGKSRSKSEEDKFKFFANQNNIQYCNDTSETNNGITSPREICFGKDCSSHSLSLPSCSITETPEPNRKSEVEFFASDRNKDLSTSQSSPSDSPLTHSELTSVPPPMALINVNRLSVQHINASLSNEFHQKIHFTSDNPNQNEFYQQINSQGGLHSSACQPKKSTSCDMCMNSSGTSSLSSNIQIIEDLGADSSFTSNQSTSETIFHKCTDASARDSGLSSHSSNSVIFSYNIVSNTPQESISSLTPPPVPPHAPHSQAATARTRRLNSVSPDVDVSSKICTCVMKATQRPNLDRICGTTIRLSQYNVEQTSPSKSIKHENITSSPNNNNNNNKSSISPIWKRKLPFSLIMSNHNNNNENNNNNNNNLSNLNKDLSNTNYSKFIVTRRSQKLLSTNLNNETDMNTTTNTTTTTATDNNRKSLTLLSQNSNEKLICLACTLNWQYYLLQPPYFDCINNDKHNMKFCNYDKFLKSTIKLTNPTNCPNCCKHVYAVGVNLFNRNPLRGLKFLIQHNFISSSAEDIAKLIINNPDLCRSKIGAFLGLPSNQIDSKAVALILFKSLDFTGLEVDEALRLVVHRFGMPIESQEIDRLLQCLTEYYFSIRWSSYLSSTTITTGEQLQTTTKLCKSIRPPINLDQLFLLFYTILLLQTSLHNVNAAKSSMGKQTVAQFIKNVQEFLSIQSGENDVHSNEKKVNNINNKNKEEPDEEEKSSSTKNLHHIKQIYSNSVLAGIYHRIKSKPLSPGTDHTTLVRRISNAIVNWSDINSLVLGNTLTDTRSNNDQDNNNNNIPFDLMETHRRLVCYCAVIQVIQNNSPDQEISVMRHLFLFNDLLLIAKDANSKKNLIKQSKFDYPIPDNLVSLLNNQNKLSNRRLSEHYSFGLLRPPLDLLTPDKCENLNHNNYYDQTYFQDSISIQNQNICLPNSRRSKSKVEYSSQKLIHNHNSSDISSRLIVVNVISLIGCQIRPFKTSIYRYGFEFWNTHNKRQSTNDNLRKINNTDKNNLSIIKTQPKQLLILVAFTKTDYENLLKDLVNCLRETNQVNLELNEFS